MAELSAHVLDLLGQHDWEGTFLRLTRYALSKARRLHWQGLLGGPMPSGFQPADVVAQAVEKVFSGERAWNPEADPDLFDYLRCVVDSDLNHLAECADNRLMVAEASLPPSASGEPALIAELTAHREDAEVVALRKEREEKADDFMLGLLEDLADEPTLKKIIEVVLDGARKRREIAEEAGITERELDNQKKRLKRRIEQFREKRVSLAQQSMRGIHDDLR